MPTPLDFPSSPTVGQQYAGSNGVLYAWDGAVWTAGAATTGLPPTGTAGGSLAGSYPNPTLATTGVTAGTKGTQYNVAQLTVTAEGRITALTEVLVRARWG